MDTPRKRQKLSPPAPMSALAARKAAAELQNRQSDIAPIVSPESRTVTPSATATASPSAIPASVDSLHLEPAPQIPITSANSQFPHRQKRNVFIDPNCRSNFLPQAEINYVIKQDSLIMGLHVGETIVLAGLTAVSVRKGQISLNGAMLNANNTITPIPIAAPTCSPLPNLVAVSSTTDGVKTGANATPQTLEAFEVVIELYSNDSGLDGIERIASISGMPMSKSGMWAKSVLQGSRNLYLKSFQILVDPMPDTTLSITPPSWFEALDHVIAQQEQMSGSPICIVQGIKGSGKSSLALHLSNRLLSTHQQVAFLDCDLGQSEKLPSGLVSLSIVKLPSFGPPFSNQVTPLRAHFLGDTSPKNDPIAYLSAIDDLISTYRDTASTSPDPLPLVVNTQGWVKGLGNDIKDEILKLLRPTHIFQLGDEAIIEPWESQIPESKGFTYSSANTTQLALHEVSTVQQPTIIRCEPLLITPPSRINQADLRILSLLSYFHATGLYPCHQDGDDTAVIPSSSSWNFDVPLVAQLPWSISWSSLHVIHLPHQQVNLEEVLHVLNGSIIGLVEATSSSPPATNTVPYDPRQLPPTPSTSQCLGLGLIRSIDPTARTFYILTPLPESLLKRVNMLVKGSIELPIAGMVDSSTEDGVAGVPWRNVPYLDGSHSLSGALGGKKRRVRRNVMRKSQAQ